MYRSYWGAGYTSSELGQALGKVLALELGKVRVLDMGPEPRPRSQS